MDQQEVHHKLSVNQGINHIYNFIKILQEEDNEDFMLKNKNRCRTLQIATDLDRHQTDIRLPNLLKSYLI